jgi:hypothetical protein
MRRWAVLALAAGLIGAAAPPPGLTDLRPITLHPGINKVPGFLPGGGTATIVEAWRGNGNAHGHHVWMVLGGASEGNAVGVVGREGDDRDPVFDTITDSPFDGERVLGAVRFVTARVAGVPATLLVTADLAESDGGVLADHAVATVRWFRLDHDADAVGRPADEFVAIGKVRTVRRYCNAEVALRDVAMIPLPRDYAGANRTDGCFG